MASGESRSVILLCCAVLHHHHNSFIHSSIQEDDSQIGIIYSRSILDRFGVVFLGIEQIGAWWIELCNLISWNLHSSSSSVIHPTYVSLYWPSGREKMKRFRAWTWCMSLFSLLCYCVCEIWYSSFQIWTELWVTIEFSVPLNLVNLTVVVVVVLVPRTSIVNCRFNSRFKFSWLGKAYQMKCFLILHMQWQYRI